MLFPIDQAPGAADRLALQMCESGGTVTFGQCEARATQVARVLRACGVTAGTHVALLMKNRRRFVEACLRGRPRRRPRHDHRHGTDGR